MYNTPDIKIAVPQGALYEDLPFRYKKSDRIKGTYSALHTLGSTEIPLNQYISIAIRPNNLPEKWQAKALIVSVSGGPSKYSFSSAGGSWKEGMVSGRIRNFGKYAIAIDSLPPTIKPVNVVKGKKVNPEGSLRFTIGDNLSGIGTFNGYIDGNWVLFNYDEKNRLIWHELKGGTSFGPGEHVLKLEVKDNKANAATWEGKISW